MKIQIVNPWDNYQAETIAVSDWIDAGVTIDRNEKTPADKHREYATALAYAQGLVESADGLQSEPGTNYCTRTQQRFFVFKCCNNGNTYIVSPKGIHSCDWGFDEVDQGEFLDPLPVSNRYNGAYLERLPARSTPRHVEAASETSIVLQGDLVKRGRGRPPRA